MKFRIALLALTLLAAPAFAQQAVQQSGSVTKGHVPYWVTSGAIGDGGSATSSPITSIGVTNNGGAGICVSSDVQTAAGRNQLCFGASTNGPATISLQNYGTAPASSFQFIVNGAAQGFLTVSPLPVVVGNLACFGAVGGGLTDCGSAPTTIPLTVGTTPIASGTSNGLLFNSAGKLGNLTTANNGALITNGSGVPSIGSQSALTALINPFTTGLSGAVPASGGGTTNFLRADSTFTAPIAGGVAYAPVGTGGVATTVKAELDRTIWVNDYGAVCNGVTNDTTAFQNAINQGQTSGLPVKFVGFCAVATTQLNITGTLDFSGASNIKSILIVPSGFSPLTINTTSAVFLHDFGISYASSAANDTAITVTASTENSGSRFWNLNITGANIGINFAKANTWVFRDNLIASISAGGFGMIVNNTNNGDSGDNTAYGNTIICAAAVQCTSGVRWTSSGGLRFTNNKILGASGASTGWPQTFQIVLASGVSTSDIFILGNSFEGLTNSGISVQLLRSGTTGILNHVVIEGNEFGGGQVCVSEPVDATGQWLSGLTISGNSCQTVNTSSSIGYSISTTVNGLYISGGLIWAVGAGSNQAIAVGTQTAANCVVGPFAKNGTIGTASTLSSCTSYAPN